MCETIPSHRDYHALLPKEKSTFRKKLLDVIDELESLKSDVQRQVDELNRGHIDQSDGPGRIMYPARKQISTSLYIEQAPSRTTSKSSQKQSIEHSQAKPPELLQMDRKFQKMSLSIPHPKEETLSRHSILGPTGFHSQWTGPISGTRVQYPSNDDLTQTKILDLNQDGQYGSLAVKKGDSYGTTPDMESILSLDDGTWSATVDESCSLGSDAAQQTFAQLNIRQPSVPPVLAQVHSMPHAIPPSRVADPRPGPVAPSVDGAPDCKSYHKLHIPVKMMECFLRLAEMNTSRNLETCGVLAGSLKNRTFFVSTLIIPKQEATSDSCQTTDEEEIFNVQDKRSLFPLGWIHTHPTQTCFMSSIDLHTHYSYQIMLPEAIAIVMAPTDTSRTHGIFHLSDPTGVSVIRNCQERGFHPHEEPLDGNPIYEHCSHVYMDTVSNFDVVDLRDA